MITKIIPGSVVENLKRIRGEDKKINTLKEAKALLEYMQKADIRCTEDNLRLYNAYQEAQIVIKYGENADNKTAWAYLYKKVKQRGEVLLSKISERVNSWSRTLASL